LAFGEHYRPDYIASSPAVILGAAAAEQRFALSKCGYCKSSDSPDALWDFATIDLLSGGRAETNGFSRGSFIESFPLFWV